MRTNVLGAEETERLISRLERQAEKDRASIREEGLPLALRSQSEPKMMSAGISRPCRSLIRSARHRCAFVIVTREATANLDPRPGCIYARSTPPPSGMNR